MTYFDTHDSLSSNRRVLAAVLLSVVVHIAVLANWQVRNSSPPMLSEMKPIEVTLVTENPRPVIRTSTPVRPAPAPRTEPVPTPAPVETVQPATAEQSAPQPIQETMVEARSDVASLDNPKPPYPLAARRQGAEGTALLSVFVRIDGTCGHLHLKQSSGYSSLDAAALDTVRRWRFVPARRGDMPVESWVDVPIRFRLERS